MAKRDTKLEGSYVKLPLDHDGQPIKLGDRVMVVLGDNVEGEGVVLAVGRRCAFVHVLALGGYPIYVDRDNIYHEEA